MTSQEISSQPPHLPKSVYLVSVCILITMGVLDVIVKTIAIISMIFGVIGFSLG